MSGSTLDTIKQHVDAAIDDTDDSEVHFKLRTASQLVDVVQYHTEGLSETLEDSNLNDDLETKLRDLGYIE